MRFKLTVTPLPTFEPHDAVKKMEFVIEAEDQSKAMEIGDSMLLHLFRWGRVTRHIVAISEEAAS